MASDLRQSNEQQVDASPAANRAREFRVRPNARIAELSLAAFRFRQRCCHRELGFSSLRDYVRARAGIQWAAWSSYVRAGRVLTASPQTSIQFTNGQLAFSTVERMASQADPSRWEALASELAGLPVRQARDKLALETKPANTPPAHMPDGTIHVSISMPVAVASYVEDTVELAAYLLGDQATDERCLDAICAEAATEINATVEIETAVSRLDSSMRLRPGQIPRPASDPLESEVAQKDQPKPIDAKALAGQVDARIVRLLQEHQKLDMEREDELLSMLHDDVHGQCGFPNFERFVKARLGISARTSHAMRRRARERRANHPLAIARAHGQLSAFQFDELHRLERSAGIPRSSLGAWIAEASRGSTRQLTLMVNWGIRRSREDYCGLSGKNFAPPSRKELQTSIQSPTAIAANPAIPEWEEGAPSGGRDGQNDTMVAIQWSLSEETVHSLLQLMASVAEQARLIASRRLQTSTQDLPLPPPWWSLLRICYVARTAWADLIDASARAYEYQHILERDRFQCAAPECTKRRQLETHHIIYQSRGGNDHVTNLVTLCHYHHHHGEHGGRIRVRGEAHEGGHSLKWNMGVLGQWNGDRRVVNDTHRLMAPPTSSTIPSPATTVSGVPPRPHRPADDPASISI